MLAILKSLSRSPMNCKPAGLLFKWLGNYEYNLIAHHYNILPSDGHSAMHNKVVKVSIRTKPLILRVAVIELQNYGS